MGPLTAPTCIASAPALCQLRLMSLSRSVGATSPHTPRTAAPTANRRRGPKRAQRAVRCSESGTAPNCDNPGGLIVYVTISNIMSI
eukprot:scaffold3581_cov417-Prasinococcus_capsulatus_cf.AAC.5